MNYSDGSSKSAVFDLGSVTNDSTWARTSGDSSLILGSTGVTNVDRMGNTSFGPNGVNDIVLKFSDIGSLSPPPAFQNVSQATGALTLTWSGTIGSAYQLQYNTNLAQTNWFNLGTPITATDTMTTASDSIGPDQCRFYRVVEMP